MITHRDKLLRMLASLDQAMAKIDTVLQHTQAYDEWIKVTESRAEIERTHAQIITELREREC